MAFDNERVRVLQERYQVKLKSCTLDADLWIADYRRGYNEAMATTFKNKIGNARNRGLER